MKSAHDVAIEQAGDEMIERGPETAIAQYFRIGTKITVSERVSGGWLCGTCSDSRRYELGEHQGCVHIQRVKRWTKDHPAVAA